MNNWKEFWKKKGYTEEQIENHLNFERRKSKEAREKRKRNNVSNIELIKKIKGDLLGNTFYNERGSNKILSINPTVDGVGFYFKVHRVFNDKSDGDFSYFERFNEYNKDEFIKNLRY